MARSQCVDKCNSQFKKGFKTLFTFFSTFLCLALYKPSPLFVLLPASILQTSTVMMFVISKDSVPSKFFISFSITYTLLARLGLSFTANVYLNYKISDHASLGYGLFLMKTYLPLMSLTLWSLGCYNGNLDINNYASKFSKSKLQNL